MLEWIPLYNVAICFWKDCSVVESWCQGSKSFFFGRFGGSIVCITKTVIIQTRTYHCDTCWSSSSSRVWSTAEHEHLTTSPNQILQFFFFQVVQVALPVWTNHCMEVTFASEFPCAATCRCGLSSRRLAIAWMVWVPCWCDGDFVDESCGGQKVSTVRTCGVHSSSKRFSKWRYR